MRPITNKTSSVKLDIACQQLESLIRNPYAIERREKRIRDEREYVHKTWDQLAQGGNK